MKIFRMLMIMLCAGAASAYGAGLTPVQSKAQRAFYDFLDKEKMDPKLDESDNSINFYIDGVLYWVTFSENSPLLYTLNRKAYKVGDEPNLYNRLPATIAANEVNLKYPGVKMCVGKDKVHTVVEVYAARPEDYHLVFKKYLGMFEGVDSTFKAEYDIALKAEREKAEEQELERQRYLPPSKLQKSISGVSFRLLDGDKLESTPYDQTLRTYNAYYVQPRVEFNPWNDDEATFELNFKITGPDGKVLAEDGEKYTMSETITIGKTKKKSEVEFDEIGKSEKGYWKAGEYKFEIIESGKVIYTTTFNLL